MKKPFNLFALVLSAFLFVACAGMMNVKTKEDVVAKSTVETDSFKKIHWLHGPKMKASILKEATKKDHSEWQVDMYFLRAMKDEKSGKDFIQIYVSNEDTDWLFFNHAIDSDGNKLEFIEIDRQTSQSTKYGVGVIEDFAIVVNQDYLSTKANDGIRIKVYGKRGGRIINIPPFYIQGFLDRYKNVVQY